MRLKVSTLSQIDHIGRWSVDSYRTHGFITSDSQCRIAPFCTWFNNDDLLLVAESKRADEQLINPKSSGAELAQQTSLG